MSPSQDSKIDKIMANRPYSRLNTSFLLPELGHFEAVSDDSPKELKKSTSHTNI